MKTKLFILFLLTGCVFNAKAQLWNGYVLVAPSNGTTATLYDTNWTSVYHTWTGLGSTTGYSSYIMPGGFLWRAAKGGTNPTGAPMGPICGRITKHDYSGALIWDYIYNDNVNNYVSHHDIQPMPNGNVLVIAYEKKTAAEVASAGCTAYTGIMWPDKIVEIQPTGATTGTVVWEWHAWDHLMQNTDVAKANYVSSLVNNPQLMNINVGAGTSGASSSDWLHMNGVDYNPMLDQVAFSSHNQDEWYIIDHSTTTAEAASHAGGNSGKGGDILYRWGNPANYGAAGTAVLDVTHDAHWADEFSTVPGRLCGYNNKGVSASQSAIDQIITPVNGYNYTITSGSAYLPASYTSRKTATGLYSSNMGSTQQLPNGNEYVCEATAGTVWEFNAAGVMLSNHIYTGVIAQSRKYSACYINNTPPAIPTVTTTNNTLQSSMATSYQWYKNGALITGATSQTYNATQSGIYVVRITDVNGCVYQYSKGYKHTYTPDAVAEIDFSDKIQVYPNPTSGIVTFKNASVFGKQFSIQVIDIYGNIVKTFYNANAIDISSLSNGMYQIKLTSPEGVATKKIILTK